jgi:hypothetical protein
MCLPEVMATTLSGLCSKYGARSPAAGPPAPGHQRLVHRRQVTQPAASQHCNVLLGQPEPPASQHTLGAFVKLTVAFNLRP